MNKVVEYKKVVRQSWTMIESIIDRLNTIFHEKLNEIDASTEAIFKDSFLIENSAAPFLTIISTAVSKLDDLDSLVPILQAQGKLQRKAGAKAKQYDSLGSAFLFALEQTLAQVWNKAVKEAWTWIYVFVAKVMQPAEDDESKKKNAVRRTWGMMEKIYAPFSDLLFKTLLESDAGVAADFQGVDLAVHKPILIQSINGIVSVLDDKEKFLQKISLLAKNNMPYSLCNLFRKTMEMKHYKLFGDAFLRTLMAALGQEFTPEVRDAWTWFYSLAAKSMIAEIEEIKKSNAAAAAAQAATTSPQTIAISVISETGVKKESSGPSVEAKIKLIQDSWALALPKAPAVISFFYEKLFAVEPELKSLFSGIDMMAQKVEVGETITQAVGLLGKMSELTPLLDALGKKHVNDGITAKHYESFSTAFLETLSHSFGSGFSSNLKEAWTWGVALVCEAMKGDNYSSSSSPKDESKEDSKPQTKPVLPTLPPLVPKEISVETKIRLVQESWASAAPLVGEVMDYFYKRFFEVDPSIPVLFKSTDMAAQKKMVASTITKAVGMLTSLDDLIPVLKQLGAGHLNYGVQESHYNSFGVAFMDTLAHAFGKAFSADLKASWSWVVGVIAETMKGDLYNSSVSEQEPVAESETTAQVAEPVTEAVPVTAVAPVVAAPVVHASVASVEAVPVAVPVATETPAVPVVAETPAVTVAAPVVIVTAPAVAPVVVVTAPTAAPVVAVTAPTAAPVVAVTAPTAAPVVAVTASTAAPVVAVAAPTVAPVVATAPIVAVPVTITVTQPSVDTHTQESLSVDQKVKLIQASWVLAAVKSDLVFSFFYKRFFELDPEIEGLFVGVDMEKQKVVFADSITSAVGLLNNLNELAPTLQELGKRHIHYGVKEKHYDTLTVAFLDTLSHVLGSSFTAELKSSWTWVLRVICDAMKGDLYAENQVEKRNSAHATVLATPTKPKVVTIEVEALERMIATAVNSAVSNVLQSPQFSTIFAAAQQIQYQQAMYSPMVSPYGFGGFAPEAYGLARPPSAAPFIMRPPSAGPDVQRAVSAVADKLAGGNQVPGQYPAQQLDFGYRPYSPAPYFPAQPTQQQGPR